MAVFIRQVSGDVSVLFFKKSKKDNLQIYRLI